MAAVEGSMYMVSLAHFGNLCFSATKVKEGPKQ